MGCVQRSGLGVAVLLLAAVLVTTGATAKSERKAAIVVDSVTGEVLYEKQADRRHYPASLTKMMTLYLLFDAVQRGQLSMNSPLPVSKHAAAQPPSKVGVKAGGSITVEQAIHSLAIKSGNDVAVVVAEALGGSEANFGRQMTAMARKLGMWRTTFFNASGLPDKRQLSTPRDMAKLSRALLYDFPRFYHYFSTPGFSYQGRQFNSHNRLLYSYGGADGIKTGYTRAAGYNISVSAVRGGRRLIAVVFGADSSGKRNTWAASLLDRAYPKARQGHPKQQLAALDSGGKLPALQPRLTDSGPAPKVQPLLPVPPQTNLAAATTPAPKQQPAPPKVQPAAAPAPKPVVQAAPTAAAPKPSQTLSGGGLWAIQVGAFSVSESAHDAASQAIQATQVLGNGNVEVVEFVKGENRFFRGRVSGLAETQARQACDFRIVHGAPCLVVAPGS
ncbi:MAG: D-alanyl-D-alanine carboxypeptidase family protein [Kiloniellales bacterium]